MLGIERGGRTGEGAYVGVPRGPTGVHAGDVLVTYGRAAHLDELDRRPAGAAGDRAHAEAVARHHRTLGLPDRRGESPAAATRSAMPRTT